MNVSFLMVFAVLCAYFVKGVCGFANTIVFTSILSFQNDNISITPLDLLLGIPANLLVAYRQRRVVRLRIWAPLAALALAGSIPGMFFLKFGNASTIKVVLGFTIIGVGVDMLSRELRTEKKPANKGLLLLIGLVSGFISGLFGIGAVLAAYIGRTTDGSDSFRGNLCMVFLANGISRLIFYVAMGIITLQTVKTALVLIPFMLLGLWLGTLAHRHLDERKAQLIIIVMLMISGVSLILMNL